MFLAIIYFLIVIGSLYLIIFYIIPRLIERNNDWLLLGYALGILVICCMLLSKELIEIISNK